MGEGQNWESIEGQGQDHRSVNIHTFATERQSCLLRAFLSQDAMHTAEHNVLSSLELRPWLTVQYTKRPTTLYTYCVSVNAIINQSLLTWWLKQQNYFEVHESVKRQGTKKQRNISCCEFDLYAQRIMLKCRTITDEAWQTLDISMIPPYWLRL